MTVIRWYRSWPKHPKAPGARNSAHVVDHLPRIEIDQYDYLTADPLPSDRPGFCLLEWDVALSSDERQRFAIAAAKTPNRILVAPYALYPFDGNPEWAHRYNGGTPVPFGSSECDTFGLGCAYLPYIVIEAFRNDLSSAIGMTDASLSRFVLSHYGRTRIDWSFRPQHLSGD